MSYIWVSDLHVKPASSYRKTLLTGDAFYALDQIERYVQDHEGITDIIFGGDVYDTNQPPGEAVNRLAALIARMTKRGIRVWYIEGNHDRINRNPYLPECYYDEHRLLSSIGALPLNDSAPVIDGLTFRGIDYRPGDKLHDKLAVLEPCDVLCLHAGFKHLLGFEEAFDLTMQDIPDVVEKMVLVGHIHVQSTMEYNRPKIDKPVTVHSSGSTWVWRVDEADKKHGFLHFEGTTPTFVELDCRKYFDIDCEQDILDTMAESHALPPVLRYPREALPGLDHSKYPGVRLIPVSGDVAVEELLDLAENQAADLVDALFIGVPPDEYPAEYVFMKALLDSEDPPGFLKEYLLQQKALLKETA